MYITLNKVHAEPCMTEKVNLGANECQYGCKTEPRPSAAILAAVASLRSAVGNHATQSVNFLYLTEPRPTFSIDGLVYF